MVRRCSTSVGRCRPCRPRIVHPVKANVLQAAADAVAENLIVPILIGPKARICGSGACAKIDITPWEVIDTEHSHEAAEKAAALAAAGVSGRS